MSLVFGPSATDVLDKSDFREVATVESVNGDDLKAEGRRSTGNYAGANVSRGFFSGKNKEQRDRL